MRRFISINEWLQTYLLLKVEQAQEKSIEILESKWGLCASLDRQFSSKFLWNIMMGITFDDNGGDWRVLVVKTWHRKSRHEQSKREQILKREKRKMTLVCFENRLIIDRQISSGSTAFDPTRLVLTFNWSEYYNLSFN